MTSWFRTGLTCLLLAVLAGTPALAALCRASCADPHAEATHPAATCHESASRPEQVVAPAAGDPCGTHDRASGGPAARIQALRDVIDQPSGTTSPASAESPQPEILLARVVTPRPAPPPPSRPPLALRV